MSSQLRFCRAASTISLRISIVTPGRPELDLCSHNISQHTLRIGTVLFWLDGFTTSPSES